MLLVSYYMMEVYLYIDKSYKFKNLGYVKKDDNWFIIGDIKWSSNFRMGVTEKIFQSLGNIPPFIEHLRERQL